jgi:hypothetical protein
MKFTTSIKYFFKKLSCINTIEEQTNSDQYLIQEYKRLGLIEKQKFEQEQKLLEQQEQQEQQEQEKLLEEQKVSIINIVFLQYKEQYKEFYSTHHSPIHSHFNKTDFVELCNTMNFTNEIELIDKLNDYNNKKRQDNKAYKNLSTKRRLKCDVFNFYLFI